MNRIIDFVKKNYLYISFFFISFFVFLFAMIFLHIAPFGDNTLMFSDLSTQEYPMFFYFKDSVFNGNLLYSWVGSFGGPFYRMFFYYMSAPLNWLVLFFNKNSIHVFITFLVYIKLFLAGESLLFYLKRKYNSNSISLLIPALLYSYSAFALNFYAIINWLDILIILPILTYSIERLIDKHRAGLYILTLVIMMFINYYLGYMLCIYTIIYFVIYNISYVRGKNWKQSLDMMSKNFFIILGSTIIFMLLSSVFLLPNYYTSTTFYSISVDIPTSRSYDFKLIDLFVTHLPFTSFNYNYIPNENPPYVYCGILSLLFIIPFIFNKKIKKSDKFLLLSLLLIFIAFFRIPILDHIINAFHYPNGFPYRYSFIYIFVLINILAKQLLDSDKRWWIIIPSLIVESVLIYLLVIKKDYYLLDSKYFIIITIMVVCNTLVYLIKNNKSKYLLLFLTIIEVLIVSTNTFRHRKFNNLYSNDTQLLINSIKDNRYRIVSKTNSNLPYYYGYNSIPLFSSTLYSGSSMFVGYMGIDSNGMSVINYDLNTPIFNSLMDVKYIFNMNIDNNYYKNIGNDLAVNNYPLGMMYGVDSANSEFETRDFMNSQNNVVHDFTGINDVLENVKYNRKKIFDDDTIIVYEYILNEDNVFFYDYGDSTYYIINGDEYGTIYKIKESYLQQSYFKDKKLNLLTNPSINSVVNKKIIVAYLKGEDDNSIQFMKLNDKKFVDMYNYLSQYQVTIDEINTKGLKARYNFDKDMLMFTTIPYDEGWTIYVDGNEVEKKNIYDAFVGFDAKKGEHEVVFKYEIPYLKKGIIISSITLFFVIIYNIFKKVRKHGNR